MKKIFLAAGIIFTATVTFGYDSIGGKHHKEARKDIRSERRADNRTQVSDFTKNKFRQDFPNARDVNFVRTKNFDEVAFISGKKNRKIMKAYYDLNSDLIGTTQLKSFADLPGNSPANIHKNYAGYKTVEVIKFIDNGDNETDMNLFSTRFDDKDAYFVELAKNNREIVVKVDLSGDVSFFKDISTK